MPDRRVGVSGECSQAKTRRRKGENFVLCYVSSVSSLLYQVL